MGTTRCELRDGDRVAELSFLYGRAATKPDYHLAAAVYAYAVEPLPEVARVVFISTPHRGSFVAGWRIVTNRSGRS